MRKYDINICKCGRIHAVREEDVNNAIINNKEIMLICGGCGNIKRIGADNYGDGYSMYTINVSANNDNNTATFDTSIFAVNDNKKAVDKIIYSEGYKVYMKTGYYANTYYNGIFEDTTSPDFTDIMNYRTSATEMRQFIDKYYKDRRTVNMKIMLREIPEDVLEELSGYYIDSFDWTDTKFDKWCQ